MRMDVDGDVERRLRDALHVAVVNATRRIRDHGLRDRVLVAEGRHVVAENLESLLGRRWADEFGGVHCPCGRALIDPRGLCRCGRMP